MIVSQRLLARLFTSRTSVHCSCISLVPARSNIFRDYATSSKNAQLFNKDDEFMKKFTDQASQPSSAAADREYFEE